MRSPYGNPLSPLSREKERGSISVPFLLLSVILAGAAVSALTYAMSWRAKVALQLRLDACVEKTALDLKRIQNQIESSNLRMKLERAAAIAAALPSGGASLKAAKAVLTAEKLFQEALRLKWKLREGAWVVSRGCDGKADLFFPLPTLRWWRPPDDSIGPLPLEWEGTENLTIRIWKSNRFSQARVSKGQKDNDEDDPTEKSKTRWSARYIARVGIRPNSD